MMLILLGFGSWFYFNYRGFNVDFTGILMSILPESDVYFTGILILIFQGFDIDFTRF